MAQTSKGLCPGSDPVALPPIDPERQIRILNLIASEDETAQISCELSVLTVTGAGQLSGQSPVEELAAYDALSYSWGSSKCDVPIAFDNGSTSMKVTLNLWMALLRLRRKNEGWRLWIDQMCIDQSNLVERSCQVQFMGEIYKQASRVIVWLGDDSHEVLSRSGGALAPELLGEFLGERQGRWQGALHTSKSRNADDDFQRMLKVMPSRWWERIWVVQEVALARIDPLVMFGSHQVSWNWLTFAGKYPRKKPLATAAQTFRNETIASGHNQMIFLRDIVQRTTSTDPRDKVYALLGLLHPAVRDLIRPDYAVPVESVFAQATYASIAGSGGFDLMAFKKERRPADLSSWSYDFTEIESRVLAVDDKYYREQSMTPKDGLETFMEIIARRPFNSRKAQVVYDVGHRALTVKGAVFDYVEAVPSPTTATVSDAWTDQAVFSRSQHGLPYSVVIDQVLGDLSDENPYHRPSQLAPGHKERKTLLDTIGDKMHNSHETRDEVILMHLFNAWRRRFILHRTPREVTFEEMKLWSEQLHCRSLFSTKAGFFGIGHWVKPGDLLFSPDGAFAPMLLRKPRNGAGDEWEFQSFAFVNGIMDQELQETGLAANLEEADVVLI